VVSRAWFEEHVIAKALANIIITDSRLLDFV